MFREKRNNTWIFFIAGGAILLITLFTVWPNARIFAFKQLERPLAIFIAEPEPPAVGSNAYLLNLEARMALLEEENALLRRAQLIVGDHELPSTIARVLWYDPDPTINSIRVSIPKLHRVRVGDAVLAPGNIFIGVVEKVGNISAEVRLLDDPEFRISARAESVDGILVGVGDGSLKLTLVPAQDIPTTGSAVRTAGKEDQIPEGLLIGTVSVERSNPADPFAQLSVIPAVSISSLSAVTIIMTEVL